MTTKPTIPEGYRPYGSTNPEYLPALTTFCEQRGYRVHQKFYWACLRRLQNPSHTCTRCDKRSFPRPYDALLDHFILLKAVDDSHWAYLGQPYFPERRLHSAATELCWSGRCNTFEVIEPAPYGHATTGILLIGNTKEQMWPKETKAIMRERIEALQWEDIKNHPQPPHQHCHQCGKPVTPGVDHDTANIRGIRWWCPEHCPQCRERPHNNDT